MPLSPLHRAILETLQSRNEPVRADNLRTMVPRQYYKDVRNATVMTLQLRPLIAEGWVDSRTVAGRYKEYWITPAGAAYLEGRGMDRAGRAQVAKDIIAAWQNLENAPPSLDAADRAKRAWQASLAPLLAAGYPLVTQDPNAVLGWCYGVLIQT